MKDKMIAESVHAIELLSEKVKHNEIAKNHIHLLTTDMVKLVDYYSLLRIRAPATYLQQITSGKMAKNFKKVFAADKENSIDIIILTKHEGSLEILQRAVSVSEGNENLSEEEVEDIAMHIMRGIIAQSNGKRTVRNLAIKHARNLVQNKQDSATIDAEVETILTTNYLR